MTKWNHHMPGRRSLVVLGLLATLLLDGCIATPEPVAKPLGTPAITPKPTPVTAAAPPLVYIPQSFSGIVNSVMPGVVYLYAERRGADAMVGSGVILRSDGYILTNRHVVENNIRVEVTLHDRRVYEASDVWLDDINDLAVVRIPDKELSAVPFGDPDTINVGDWVLAIGHALGVAPTDGGASVTTGIVSNLGRSLRIGSTPYYDVIQTSAPINPGNSGGPLLNMSGEVIGINSLGAVDAQNIGYAINIASARHVFEDLIKYGKPHHPYLGGVLGDVTPLVARTMIVKTRVGAVIDRLVPDGPLAKAGLREGDTIVQFDNVEITSSSDLIRAVWRHDVDQTVSISYARAGAIVQATVTLQNRPSNSRAI